MILSLFFYYYSILLRVTDLILLVADIAEHGYESEYESTEEEIHMD